MVETITQKTKMKVKERPTDAQLKRTEEGKKLVPIIIRSYFTHNPFNVVCM
jgi:hypothetical protein